MIRQDQSLGHIFKDGFLDLGNQVRIMFIDEVKKKNKRLGCIFIVHKRLFERFGESIRKECIQYFHLIYLFTASQGLRGPGTGPRRSPGIIRNTGHPMYHLRLYICIMNNVFNFSRREIRYNNNFRWSIGRDKSLDFIISSRIMCILILCFEYGRPTCININIRHSHNQRPVPGYFLYPDTCNIIRQCTGGATTTTAAPRSNIRRKECSR